MKALTIFNFGDMPIRTFGTKHELWFVARDILTALGISLKYMGRTLKTLDDDEKGVVLTDTPGGEQEVWIISEPGFYKIALRARTESAKAFTRWVTHKVLPSIRKHGYYLDPRWGFAPTDDGKWGLASGEELTPNELRRKAEKLGINISERTECKDIVQYVNDRERYLAMIEKYPYTEDDIQRSVSTHYQEANWYECFIPEGANRSELMCFFDANDGTRYSEKFVELVRKIDNEKRYWEYTE